MASLKPYGRRGGGRNWTPWIVSAVLVGVPVLVAAAVGASPAAALALCVGGALGLGLYLLPALVAHDRGHRDLAAIAVLNVLGGWTLLGWIAALVWACWTPESMRLDRLGRENARLAEAKTLRRAQ